MGAIEGLIKYRDLGIGTTAAAKTLTGAYQASNVVPVPEGDQIMLLVKYTPAADTRNLTVKVEFGDDASSQNFFELSIGSDGSATSGVVTTTLYANRFTFPGATHAVAYTFRLPISAADKFMKVSVVEDGATNFGTTYIQYGTRGI